jgi:hypothetical protein
MNAEVEIFRIGSMGFGPPSKRQPSSKHEPIEHGGLTDDKDCRAVGKNHRDPPVGRKTPRAHSPGPPNVPGFSCGGAGDSEGALPALRSEVGKHSRNRQHRGDGGIGEPIRSASPPERRFSAHATTGAPRFDTNRDHHEGNAKTGSSSEALPGNVAYMKHPDRVDRNR